MGEPFRSRFRLHSARWPADLAIAVLAALVNVAVALGSGPTTAYEFVNGGTPHLALAAAGGLVLWSRRSHPLITFALSTTSIAVVAALQ